MQQDLRAINDRMFSSSTVGAPRRGAILRRLFIRVAVVYISDHAKDDYESIVSDIGKSCDISLVGNRGTHNATVVDQHLAAFLDVDSLTLEFDMGAWAVVESHQLEHHD